MKTCPRCGFHHSDAEVRCVRCQSVLDPPDPRESMTRAERKAEDDPARSARRNFPSRAGAAIRLALYRLSLKLIDPIPRNAMPRSPWGAGLLSLAIPGAGQLRNHQPRKGGLYCAIWIGWIAAVVATFYDSISDWVIIAGVAVVILAFHDAFMTALYINRDGRKLAWQYRAVYFFAWICYFGALVCLAIWIGWWTLLQRKHIFHNELAPWLRQGESAVVERIHDHWLKPRIGEVVYYKPGPIHMELPGGSYMGSGVSEATLLDVRSINMIERIVGGPGDTFEYRGGAFYRNGRPVPPSEAPLRTDQLGPFKLQAPAGKYIIVYSYTGAGLDALPIATLHDDYKSRQEAPPLNAPGWIVTGWEAACYVAPHEIEGRMWFVYEPPTARRMLR